MTTAVVLAAGRGTRMGSLTAATPKPLLAVAGRALIEHVLSGLALAGVQRAIVVTGYRGEQIEAALGDGRRLGLDIAYRRQAHPDGTARAVLLAEPLVGSAPFVLSWGDILVPPSFYSELVANFAARPCDALLAVNEVEDPWQGAAVYLDPSGRVTRLEEKPPRGSSTTHWNNAGVMLLRSAIFDYARRIAPSPRGEYELPQAVAAMVGDGRLVRGLAVRGYWSDVGTPADLVEAERRIASQPPSERAS
jgi:dTDP-glucose pyrophosphorylase